MNDIDVLKVILFILVEKNGGQITIDDLDITMHLARYGDLLNVRRDADSNSWIIEVKRGD